MGRARARGTFAVFAVALLGFGCGNGEGPTAPRRARPADEVVTFHQVMIGYAVPGRTKFARSKAEAFDLAQRVLARARGGEPFDALIRAWTDDRDELGRPFNRGSYTIARRATPTLPQVKAAVFGLAPGALLPEPLDTGLAYLVIRRE
jgi:hypothetical protein